MTSKFPWMTDNKRVISFVVFFSAFYGLDKDVLLKALRILVDQRRAQLLNIGTDAEGVKFFQWGERFSDGKKNFRNLYI